MKSYRNKKVYNFKKKYRRKKRIRSASLRNEKLGSVYNKTMEEKFRAKNRAILIKKLKGQIIEFPLHKKTMSWDW